MINRKELKKKNARIIITSLFFKDNPPRNILITRNNSIPALTTVFCIYETNFQISKTDIKAVGRIKY